MASATNNKKPAPAQPAVRKTTGEKNHEKFNKLPPAKRVAVRLRNGNARLAQMADRVKNWPGQDVAAARTWLTQALEKLNAAAEVFEALPDDYRARAAKGGGGKVELLPGSLIRITDKRVSEYEGVLEPKQMRGIKVKEVRGNKVVAVTKDGIQAMFARGHVCPDVE